MKAATIFGTRPEAIKMAPVIRRLRSSPAHQAIVLVTGQHKEMLQEALDAFGIKPDLDLALMRHDQTLADFAARALVALEEAVCKAGPDLVLVHGETTTTLAVMLAACYCKESARFPSATSRRACEPAASTVPSPRRSTAFSPASRTSTSPCPSVTRRVSTS